MAIAAARKMTLEEFEALPEGPPNYEFEEGELIPAPSPTITHQDVIVELALAMRSYARHHGGRLIMGVDVHLPDGRVFVPDLAFLTGEHLDEVSARDGKVHGAPDLVVEVISQTTHRDRVHKYRIYDKNGVAWYWIVDPEELIIEEY